MKKQYRVTDVYSVRPAFEEQRFQLIEEINPPKRNGLMDIIYGIAGLVALVFFGFFIFGLIANLLGFTLK